MRAYSFGCAAVVAVALGTARAGVLADWQFDEACGNISADAVSGLEATLSPSMGWATGAFGKALAFNGKSSTVSIPEVPGWVNSESFTISLRAYWNNGGNGRHPNLLTAVRWGSEPSLMLAVSNGSLVLRYGARVDGKWKECGIPMLKKVPSGRWTHIAITYAKPILAAYVDGKKVGEVRWPHALAGSGGFTLGGWQDRVSHDGLIDDLVFYDVALSPAKIKSLAADENYKEIEGYQDDGTGGIAKTRIVGQELPVAATVQGDHLIASFDAGGRMSSLVHEKGGRELVGQPVPFVLVTLMDGRVLASRRLRQGEGGDLVFVFPKGTGDAVVSAKSGGGGIVFTVKSLNVKGVSSFSFARVLPVCQDYRGGYVNGCSDERDAVVLRGFEVRTVSGLDPSTGLLEVKAERQFGLTGWRAGLVAAPRSQILERLKAMTEEAGVPHTDAGGAWSLGSDGARRSYLFATVVPRTTDCWIDLAERGGFSILHFTQDWAECLGHYEVRREFYPNGISDMKDCVDRIHAAGLLSGIHTLTACIAPQDSWISPLCTTNLYADATYTLAKALGEEDTEIIVNECPIMGHDRVMTYMSNGNVLRIGNELLQYDDVRRESPYGFTGVRRGAFRTKVSSHPAGDRCDYVHQRYMAFYPNPDSPLADELAARLAAVYNGCGHDEFYFDGSEGMGSRYGIDAMRWKIAAALAKKPGAPSIEASCRGANNWWFQSRMGTSDHPVWAAKRFHDNHVKKAISVRKCEFLEPQMGWWQPRQAKLIARGHFLDDMEYFAAKNAGIDAAMSVQGVNACDVPFGVMRQMTVLGWYERLRLARAFKAEVQELLAKPQEEFRLRQGDDGDWTITPVKMFSYRSLSSETREKTFSIPTAMPLALRIEALYGASSYSGRDAMEIIGAQDASTLKVEAAEGVRPSFSTMSDAEHGQTLRLAAHNDAADKNGAWARIQKSIPFPYLDLQGRGGFGVWVKGDGSGALVVLQAATGREYNRAFSDHQIRLDFTGWRYFSFLARERDVDNYHEYVWPYGVGDSYAIYRVALDVKHVGTLAVYLNDIPKGKTATVEVSAVKALRVLPDSTVTGTQVTVNGTDVAFPFQKMAGGDYAELEDGRWTLFDEKGEPKESALAKIAPSFRAGDNVCAVQANDSCARLEVTFTSLGQSMSAMCRSIPSDGRRHLSVEFEQPFKYAPTKGFPSEMVVKSRPDEKAQLALTIYGPIDKPSISWKTMFGLFRKTTVFPAVLNAGERIVCRDGCSWQKMPKGSGKILEEGRLEEPLPTLDGVQTFYLSCADVAAASARVEVVKRYED